METKMETKMETGTASMMECCQDESNRSEPQPVDGKEDLTISYCTCGRRHFELTVDPGELGAWGGSL